MSILPFLNGFQVAGDISHFAAIFVLLFNILRTKSCSGISGTTQVLFLVAYTVRYLVDSATVFVSTYNTVVSVAVIVFTTVTIYCIYVKFRKTYDGNYDTMRAQYLVGLAVIMALMVHYRYRWNARSFQTEVLSASTLYLEIVAILPQFSMNLRMAEVKPVVVYYVLLLLCYRALYANQWIYQKVHGWDDDIALASCVVQSLVYCVFFVYLKVDSREDTASSETAQKTQFPASSNTTNKRGGIRVIGGRNAQTIIFLEGLCQSSRRECFGLFGAINAKIHKPDDDGASESLLGGPTETDEIDPAKPTDAAPEQATCSVNMSNLDEADPRDVLSTSPVHQEDHSAQFTSDIREVEKNLSQGK